MDAKKMEAVIKALPKCEMGCCNIATQEYDYYNEHRFLCDFHAKNYIIKDPNNTDGFILNPDVSDLDWGPALRELFVEAEVVVIHDDTPII